MSLSMLVEDTYTNRLVSIHPFLAGLTVFRHNAVGFIAVFNVDHNAIQKYKGAINKEQSSATYGCCRLLGRLQWEWFGFAVVSFYLLLLGKEMIHYSSF